MRNLEGVVDGKTEVAEPQFAAAETRRGTS
jgi:hypothetical protein